MDNLFSAFSNTSIVWSFIGPFDSSVSSKMNIVQEEGIESLSEDNSFFEIHQSIIDAYKKAIRPGILLSITCAFPSELANWADDLRIGTLNVIQATEHAKLVMNNAERSSVLSKYCNAYSNLHKEIALYVDSKEFNTSSLRAWKTMYKEYKIAEGDYDAVLHNWAIKFEFATVMRNKKYKKIKSHLDTLKSIVMSDEFCNAFTD